MGYWTASMESCSSGEEVIVKARKPYTIRKQRERWTEEEHSRFLEALKLYGRAWQRIEEHIGTKTAIQIRSHAQKFFTKLEKEALSKGISPGQALDIDIPPPRPKRKPTNPYPRKSTLNASDSSAKEEKRDKLATGRSSCPIMEVESGKRSPDTKPDRSGMLENVTTIPENVTCTEALPLFTDATVTPIGSKSGNEQIFREVIPNPQHGNEEKVETYKMDITSDENGESKHYSDDVGYVNINRLGLLIGSQNKTATLEIINKHQQTEKIARQSSDDVEHVEKQAPGSHILESKYELREAVHSDARNTVPLANQQSTQVNTNIPRNPFMSTASAQETDSSMSFFHQLPSFPSFFLPRGQEAFRPFLNASSTFSNLIVTNLLQNPAAHSAATAAVSFWPPQDSEKSKNSSSETMNGTTPGGHVNPHTCMASIAAATVAAATAWWAMHGLFPLCHPPFPTGFPFVSAATSTGPLMMATQVGERQERRDNSSQIPAGQDKRSSQIPAGQDKGSSQIQVGQDKGSSQIQAGQDKGSSQIQAGLGKGMLGSELPEHLTLHPSESKSAPSLQSDESRGHEEPHGISLNSSGINKLASTLDTVLCESNIKGRTVEKREEFYADNRHSGNEVTDTVYIQSKEKLQESPVHYTPTVETIFARYRSSMNCFNELRKEVSKEGRLAFQALFTREELPQSFSPMLPEDASVKEFTDLGVATLPVDLNIVSCNYSSAIDHFSASDDVCLRANGCLETSTSTRETGKSKPMAPRLGFKPYKRCSMEANVGSITSEEEKGCKRLHLEGKTSNL